ncbi:MAG: PhoX family phosphatase [Gammaproteobacteria bacterium]
MKGNKHPKNDTTINPSANESITDVLARIDASRRGFLKSTLGASVALAAGGLAAAGGLTWSADAAAAPVPASNGFGGIGFESIPRKLAPVANSVEVPPGYTVEVLCPWGQPIMPGAPDWNPDATQNAAVQAMQMGMHCDGMHYFGFPGRGGPSSVRGIMCVNNEYTHEEILHGPEGLVGGSGVTIAKVRKSQAGHGVSIFEVRQAGGKWTVVRNSAFGRRLTANTPMRVSGPAAGSALLKSKKFDIQPGASVENGVNDGFSAFGSHNNCAHGYTPWGTYLTCEENWNGNFGWNASDVLNTGDAALDAVVLNNQNRYGVVQGGFGYQWHVADPRFNARTNPLEPHLYGWVVEIDPFEPQSKPVKRTALGRFKHESAQVAVSADAAGTPNRVAFYMGDDERNEYIYKFVCARPFSPTNRAANRDLLDSGVLYVAKFSDTPVPGKAGAFRGTWIALLPDTLSIIPNGNGGFWKLRELKHFSDAAADGISEPNDAKVLANILIKTRQAGDAVGATMMDRPEWTALRTYASATNGYQVYSAQQPLEVYCTLTNNNRRGGGGALSSNSPAGTTAAGGARPPVDVANPRPDNDFGHIIRWREDGNHVTATGFEWDIFALCGDTLTTKTLAANYLKTNFIGVDPTDVDFNRKIYEGDIVDVPAGSADFGAPDGLWFDQFGRLWIQTDQAGDASGDFVNVGANVMCAADPNTREIRRFLTSPRNCEVTGVVNTPDGKTMFVGIQHPGEDSTAANPTQFSNWPQSQFDRTSGGDFLAVVGGVPQGVGANIRPRSSVLVITKQDGGVIGG